MQSSSKKDAIKAGNMIRNNIKENGCCSEGVYGSDGGGWKLMNGDISIFYHPGGGKHGGSYYGISSGATGKIKVVNPETYIPLEGDKATIIYD